MKITSRGQQDTLIIGKKLAGILKPGDVVLLIGELGTGKSVIARGIARGLGIKETISSPTFTLLKEYEGEVPLYHLDAYRLDSPADLFELGLEEYLGEGILLVEWADRVYGFFDRDFLEIRIAYGEDESMRYIDLIPVGASWKSKLREAGLGGEELA
jgi:tRNA threonylcarbamoyladenosine biosynthesis protein TsaE